MERPSDAAWGSRRQKGLAAGILVFCLGVLASARAVDDPTDLSTLKHQVVSNYADLAHAGYADALTQARALAHAVETFLAAPSAAALDHARQAWIDARGPYVQTEVFRFYDGPIDAVEGLVNSWPIDEALIDYVDGEPESGIVNRPSVFGAITSDLLVSLNEKDGEKNITTGFHAIEFLLWGQDLSEHGPGQRSYLDYVDNASGGAPHADRRREYLRLVVRLLVQHLEIVVNDWSPNRASNYRTRFLALPPDEALTRMLKGAGILSGAELAGERLTVPFETKEQEDEHSCFSDTTHQDIINDALGIESVFLGRREGVHGAGLLDLVTRVDARLAARLGQQIADGVAASRAIPAPFDRAIAGRDSAPGRLAVKHTITAFRAVADSLAQVGADLGLKLSF